MTIRRALTKRQRDAIRTPQGAKVLVEAMNAEMSMKREQIAAQTIEIDGLRDNYVDLQNKYEASRKRFHKADKTNAVLASKLQFALLIEIIKYLLTVIGTGYGINIVTSGSHSGWFYVGASGVLYTVIVFWQSKTLKDK